jgi:hypothetical protein
LTDYSSMLLDSSKLVVPSGSKPILSSMFDNEFKLINSLFLYYD